MLARVEISETDTGPRNPAAGMERLCAVTRTVRPISEMIRFVVGPEGTVVPDVKQKLPGRGVWVTGQHSMVVEAVKRKVFGRSFRTPVSVPNDLPWAVENLLERATIDTLAIARKAGNVVSGFTQVEAEAGKGTCVAIFHAAEASPDGVRKIAAALKRGFQGLTEQVAIIGTVTSAQLDLALGRSNVIHAALLAGRASESFLVRWRTLERYRTKTPDERGSAVRHTTQEAPGLGSE